MTNQKNGSNASKNERKKQISCKELCEHVQNLNECTLSLLTDPGIDLVTEKKESVKSTNMFLISLLERYYRN